MAFMSIFLLFVIPGMIISAIVIGMIICYMLCVYGLEAIAKFLQFRSHGEQPWKAFIPFYSDYLWFKIYGLKELGYTYLAMHVLLFAVGYIPQDDNSYEGDMYYLVTFLQVLLIVMIYVLNAVQAVKMSKAYQLSTGIMILMVIAKPIAAQWISILEAKNFAKQKVLEYREKQQKHTF